MNASNKLVLLKKSNILNKKDSIFLFFKTKRKKIGAFYLNFLHFHNFHLKLFFRTDVLFPCDHSEQYQFDFSNEFWKIHETQQHSTSKTIDNTILFSSSLTI